MVVDVGIVVYSYSYLLSEYELRDCFACSFVSFVGFVVASGAVLRCDVLLVGAMTPLRVDPLTMLFLRILPMWVCGESGIYYGSIRLCNIQRQLAGWLAGWRWLW